MADAQSAAVIYVSADTDPKAAARILVNQPWLRLTFHDNSDFAPLVPIREGARITELEEVARGEDFVQAGVSPLLRARCERKSGR